MAQKNYYLILGINATANQQEIKAAYRELAKKYHPDKNINNKSAEDYFKEIQQAYSVLSNHAKRKKYDLSISFGNTYYQTTSSAKQKQYTPYTGNAYQYAQQQAGATHHQQYETKKPVEYKKDVTERNQLLICVAIAVVLLYFIVSYSVR
jgi:DnaJ-class molecular chaperone